MRQREEGRGEESGEDSGEGGVEGRRDEESLSGGWGEVASLRPGRAE